MKMFATPENKLITTISKMDFLNFGINELKVVSKFDGQKLKLE